MVIVNRYYQVKPYISEHAPTVFTLIEGAENMHTMLLSNILLHYTLLPPETHHGTYISYGLDQPDRLPLSINQKKG